MQKTAKGVSRIDSKKTHGWFVRIYRYPSLTFSKFFTDGVYGGWEHSLQAAELFRDVAEGFLPKSSDYRLQSAWQKNYQESRNSSTGLMGICETYSRNRNGSLSPCITVSWQDETGRNHNSRFSTKKYGREKALQMAIELRKQKEIDKISRQNTDKVVANSLIEEIEEKWNELTASYTLSNPQTAPQNLKATIDQTHIEAMKQKWNELVASYDFSIAEEVNESDEKFYEGSVHAIIVNAYERNPEARLKCISHYGSKCFVCGFDFEKVYGEAGQGIIHVHHLTPLASIGKEYQVDPIKDMRPICPNCHVVIHKKQPPLGIEKVRAYFEKQSVILSQSSNGEAN